MMSFCGTRNVVSRWLMSSRLLYVLLLLYFTCCKFSSGSVFIFILFLGHSRSSICESKTTRWVINHPKVKWPHWEHETEYRSHKDRRAREDKPIKSSQSWVYKWLSWFGLGEEDVHSLEVNSQWGVRCSTWVLSNDSPGQHSQWATTSSHMLAGFWLLWLCMAVESLHRGNTGSWGATLILILAHKKGLLLARNLWRSYCS